MVLPVSHDDLTNCLQYTNDLVLHAPLEGSLRAATYCIRLPGETELCKIRKRMLIGERHYYYYYRLMLN